MSSISKMGPQFSASNDLASWACGERLSWLVRELGLVAGVICGSIAEAIRREVYGLKPEDELPLAIDWDRNNIVVSPPGTGKGMAIFVDALTRFKRVYVLVPSVIQAHKLEASLDALYVSALGGCLTSQRKAPGIITIITTGIFRMMVRDSGSELWQEGSCLIVDEAQRILEGDVETEFLIGYAARKGVATNIVSATIDPAGLPETYGHDGKPAMVHVLQKEMHPVELVQIPGEFADGLEKIAKSMKPGDTYLFFCRSRRGVEKARRKLLEMGIFPVAVTGGHEVELQLDNIARAQNAGKAVGVVATPGTMDSSVTIPGLSVVVIDDARIVVDYNKEGFLERKTEQLPINHLWQMIRRVGRQKRADGGKDKVVLLTAAVRSDVGDGSQLPKFLPIRGCSAYSLLERMVLEAVNLNVPFVDVHEYMVSRFPMDRILDATNNLIDHGMIERVEESDGDGFTLTKKGKLVVNLPYEYEWSRLIVDATTRELKLQLCMAASWGAMEDVKFFELDFEVQRNGRSEVSEKVNLGLRYVSEAHDGSQRDFVETHGLSFRRMESVETQFELGLRALDMDVNFKALSALSETEEKVLESHLVTEGLKVGLFQIYLLDDQEKKGWREFRQVTAEGKARVFMAGGDTPVGFEKHADSGICMVVAWPLYFGSRAGNPCAELNDVTVVPPELRGELIQSMANAEGWKKLTFELREDNVGRPQMRAREDGVDFVPSRLDLQPEAGKAYWVSTDRRLGNRFYAVWIHYPVLQEVVAEAPRLAE